MARVFGFGRISGSLFLPLIRISARTLLPIDAIVDILIDAEHSTWRANLVRELFINFEVENILSIPLIICLPHDKLV